MSADVISEYTQEIDTLIITNGAAADTTTIYADTDIDDTTNYAGATEAAGGDLTLAAIATRQNVARNVVATVTDADSSITGGYAAVYGYDANGIMQRELFTFSGGTQTVTGNIPFTTVDKITIWGFAGTVANTDDNIKFGGGLKLGLPMGANCTLIDVIKESAAGSLQVVNHAGVDRTYGTYTCTSALNGTNEQEITYIFKRRIR
jgi:hypothetical protein